MKLEMLRNVAVIFILLLTLFLTGCWDVQQIKNRGIANAVFFDIGNPKKFKMGVVSTVPGSQAPTNVGTYQQFNKRHFVISGEGDSIAEAWTEAQANSFRDMFFGQIRAVVLSEKFARENIKDLLDFIGRIPLVPPNTIVLVAKGDPEKLLDMKNETNELPGNYIDFYFQSPSKRSLAIPVDLWRVNAILDRKTSDPYIPLFDESKGSYKIAGTAVFSGNHMVGELSMDETITLALIRETDFGYLTIPLGKNKHAAFDNVRSNTIITPKISSDRTLIFNVKTEIRGNLVENIPHRETLVKEKKEIESQAEMLTKRKIENLIAKLQGLNSDPVGFGGQFRVEYPHQWDKIDWHQVYPAAEFNVSTKFTLRETGLFR